MSFLCGHIKFYNGDKKYKSFLQKNTCEACDGYLLCKEHNNVNKNFTISNSERLKPNNPVKSDYIVKGYINKSDCVDCKKERDLKLQKNVVYAKYCCSHYNELNCEECEKYSQYSNGCCKHKNYGNNNIVYCFECEKERQGRWKKKSIKDNKKYRCKCIGFNYYNGWSYGGFISSNDPITYNVSKTDALSLLYSACNPNQPIPCDIVTIKDYVYTDLKQDEYHDTCYFYVCKHDVIYTDECAECKKELIINNRCKHNNPSICQSCKKYKSIRHTSICIHNIDVYKCKECAIEYRCSHDKIYTECYKCDRMYCTHDKTKSQCRICGGSALCKNEWCESMANKKYNGHCLRCFIHMFPELPNVRNYKTKEKEVVDRIKEVFPNLTWIADKKIQDGCSSKRPDLLLDLGTHLLIIEVDENKHTNYDCSCENKRLMELSQDVGHRPIVFIRFNPDSYTDLSGNKIKSCWRLNKLGVMCIENEKNWNGRISTLLQQIQYWIDNPVEKTVEIVELFY